MRSACAHERRLLRLGPRSLTDRRYGLACVKKMSRKTHGVGVHAKGVGIHYSAGQQQRVIRRKRHFVTVCVIAALYLAIDRRDNLRPALPLRQGPRIHLPRIGDFSPWRVLAMVFPPIEQFTTHVRPAFIRRFSRLDARPEPCGCYSTGWKRASDLWFSGSSSKCFGIHCRFYVESFKVVAGCQLRENVSSARSPSWSGCARQADVLGIESRLSIPSRLIHLRKPTKFSKPSTIATGPN